ncbi:MAG: MFS transporter [Spirochaetaceae bacterium]
MRDERNHNLTITILLVSVFLLVTGSALQTTLLGVRAGIAGFREESLGVVMASFSLGYVAGTTVTVHFLRTVGFVRTFAALASTASALAIAHGFFVLPVLWAVFRFLFGACYAGLVLTIESWLNQESTRENRGRVLATYGLVFWGATAAGQIGVSVASAAGLALFAVVSVALSLALVPVSLTTIDEPRIDRYERFPLRSLFAVSPIGAVGVVAVGFVGGAFWGMAPRFAQEIGGQRAVSLFMSSAIVGAVAMQWPLGRASDRMDRRITILISALVAAAAAMLIFLTARDTAPATLVLVATYGASALPLYGLTVAHINDHVRQDDLVSVAGTIVVLLGLGAAAGPIATGTVMTRLGPRALFLVEAVVLSAYAAFGIVRLHRRDRLRAPAKRHFQALPRTTQVVTHLLRRRHE